MNSWSWRWNSSGESGPLRVGLGIGPSTAQNSASSIKLNAIRRPGEDLDFCQKRERLLFIDEIEVVIRDFDGQTGLAPLSGSAGGPSFYQRDHLLRGKR